MSTTPRSSAQRDPTPLHPTGPMRPKAGVPLPRTPLIGRQGEFDQVMALLLSDEASLVTLTGAGGVGKTRLAVEIAAHVARVTDATVFFVPLAHLREADLVLPTVGQALGFERNEDSTLFARLVAFLHDRPALLVLDNLEQLPGAASHIATLLMACPALKICATSRSLVHISGEQVFRVPPLALPSERDTRSLADLQRAGSVALFVARAKAADHGFVLTETNAPSVTAICRRLDGVPLAIELAAARVPVVTPEAILALLDDRFSLLSRGALDQPDRLQSLRETIAWSHDLLSADERILFRRLAAFSDGCSLEAAESVCGDGRIALLDSITSLIHQNLVIRIEQPDDWPRFSMLESVREFAAERLAESGEVRLLRGKHAAYFTELVDRARVGYFTPTDSVPSDRLIAADIANLRAAINWQLGHGEMTLLLRLAFVGWWSWLPSEAHDWVERAIDGTLTIPDDQRPLVLASAGEFALVIQHDVDRAAVLLDDCLAIATDPADAKAIALAVWCRSILMTHRGDLASAESAATEALARWRALDEGSWRIVDAHCQSGHVAWRTEDPERAEVAFTEALDLAQSTNAHWVVPRLLLALGVCARERGEDRKAVSLLGECLRAIRDSRQHMGGHIEGFITFRSCAVDAVRQMGAIACKLGHETQAVRLLSAAATIGHQHETATWPLVASRHGRLEVPTRRVLSQTSYESARNAGTQLTVEETANEALTFADAILAPSTPTVIDPSLSRREREVLALLAQGRSNRSIAEALSLSERTVESHVLHILTKLDLDSRSAAAAHAVRHGLD